MENENNSSAFKYYYFDRDISWLSFNERVLMEAANTHVPLLERINFLSIYSSNLDEFYRVRMPTLGALHKLYRKEKIQKGESAPDVANEATTIIQKQLNTFGKTLKLIVAQLKEKQVYIVYGKPIPPLIREQVTQYFFSNVLGFLKFFRISNRNQGIFLENNKLYLAVTIVNADQTEELLVVNIPSDDVSRFFTVEARGILYIVFLDDIIKENLSSLFNGKVSGSHSLKVTRDAELNLEDVYDEDIAQKIEQELTKRDSGHATRFLHEPGIPQSTLKKLITTFNLENSVIMDGGMYHNLKDLSSLKIDKPELKYNKWPAIIYPVVPTTFLLDMISRQDVLIHTPYQSYDPILRFFNETAVITDVEHIYITMYRVATDSRILNALLSALVNGKKITVLIELKARFDEGNNLKWAKRLKTAGAEIIYTSKDLKVHAKIALVERIINSESKYVGLLATGNLNESTARFYTDHVLLTGNQAILQEVKILFKSLRKEKGKAISKIEFKHLLVARHNLLDALIAMIENEIAHAKQNLPARIILKVNNLEETSLIRKLYDASIAGVKIDLIVRSICRLVPGVEGMSENITVTRIVGRYLEHGRVCIFHNNGRDDIYLGSADWMSRNIYRRIEVCFPLYDDVLKQQMLEIIDFQLKDNIQAVRLNERLQNNWVKPGIELIQSQFSIYNKLMGSG